MEIKEKRCVIVAADVDDLSELKKLVEGTVEVKGIAGYKVSSITALRYGLPLVVRTIRQFTAKPIIYDHQKAATDIPKLGEKFAQVLINSGIDAAIIFPFGGAATEEAWISALKKAGITILVGGHMTQPKFLYDEGGFIHNEAPFRIYRIAAENGVKDFVVPGNKPEDGIKYKVFFENLIGKGNFNLYAPGFIDQGGNITEFGKEVGDFRAIVGSAIYDGKTIKEIRERAMAVTSQL
jgi:orotidine-5'-phosphate decarboxylase